METKQAKKRQKTGQPDRWLALVTRYNFLFAGVICHCVLLLLLAMVLTLHDASGQRYQTLLDLLAIFLVVVLVIIWQLRWTYPLSNELPLLILLLWVVLSSRISATHCFCCHHHHHHHDDGTVRPHQLEDATAVVLASGDNGSAGEGAATPGAALVVPPDKVAAEQEEDDFLLEYWRWAMSDCRAEHFNFFFSVLCLAAVFCAFFTELRSAIGSLLFRLCTAVLVAVVAVLFFVSPSLCSKFSLELSDSFVTVARITLFEALWALNRYGRGCERLLSRDYQQSVAVTQRHLMLETKQGGVPSYITDYTFTTPRAHNLHITRLYKYVAARYHYQTTGGARRKRQSVKTRRRAPPPQQGRHAQHTLILPLGRGGSPGLEGERRGARHHHSQAIADDDDDYYDARDLLMDEDGYSDEEEEEEDFDDENESSEEEAPRSRLQGALPSSQQQQQTNPQDAAAAEEKTREHYALVQVWQSLWHLSHSYRQRYIAGILSWKNRGYSKHVLHLIDLAICLWVLLVCPPWLWLAPLEILWLLYYIYVLKTELAQAQGQSAVLGRIAARDDQQTFGGVAVLPF